MIKKFTKLLFFLLFAFTFVNGQDSVATKKKRNSFAGVPLINYNRTQGIMVGALAAKYYKINQKDTISPSSQTGVVGIYTEQKSYVAIVFSKLYFAQDRWRMTIAGGAANVNFQFYFEDPVLSVGNYYDYSTKASFAVLQVQRNIFNRIYIGPTISYTSATTKYAIPDMQGNDSVSNSSLNNIGYIISNDTRDHIQFPTHGMFMNFKNQFYRSWIGSNHKFEKYVLTYNQFFKLSKNDDTQILGIRANLNIAHGDVPFEAQSVVGGDDIRGYSQGKYRGDQVYTLQAEYRWNFYKRWGAVGFAGVASAVGKFGDITKELLPGVGAGVRFRLLPHEKVNIGIDGGVGKDDYSITFRLGEALGR